MDIQLVTMPCAELQRPSIALGLLGAALDEAGFECEVVHANFEFAQTIGLVAYQALESTPTDHLLGEWIFAGALRDGPGGDDDNYLDLVLEVRSRGFPDGLARRKAWMRWIRSRAETFVDDLARRLAGEKPRIVGASSVFQQHAASLALLRKIRELSPGTVTLIGGANCEGEMGMETLRSFPWIDCVVSGEADGMITSLCRLLLEQGSRPDPAAVPRGAFVRNGMDALDGPAPRRVVEDLDTLPVPNYDDYFRTLDRSPLSGLVQPGLLAESSRGCWWGEKSHCTFCGLNGIGMRYRSKSARRVVDELSTLRSRYGLGNIQFVDNILDMAHLKTVLPELASLDEKYSLFYETKANLKRHHVELLADAGVGWIQPGIESLDDRILGLLGKGNSAVMNLRLLRWTREFGIHAAWNMLSGVPGESDEWYDETAEWIPAVFHLQPPSGMVRVRYDRFSPYHMRPEGFGLRLVPNRAYRYVYDLEPEALSRLAYFFEDSEQPGHVHRAVHALPGQNRLQWAVTEWNRLWEGTPPVLEVVEDDDGLDVRDSRPRAWWPRYRLGRVEAAVYGASDAGASEEGLLESVAGAGFRDSEIGDAIEVLVGARLVLPLHGKLLSLGVRPAPERTATRGGIHHRIPHRSTNKSRTLTGPLSRDRS